MSKEWMQQNLVKLGFTEMEAQVYVFLATEGPTKTSDIAESLRIHKRGLYRILSNLKRDGIVTASSEYPARFSAVLFEKVLDLSIKAKIEQQEALQASKEEFLSTWRSFVKEESTDS